MTRRKTYRAGGQYRVTVVRAVWWTVTPRW